MRRGWLIVLLLLPACATPRHGGEFVGRDRTAGDALRCAMGEAGRMGYRITSTPLVDGVRDGHFNAERWLSPRETGVRSLGVLAVSVRENGVGETRLRVDADRFEETTGVGASGPALGGPMGPGVVPRPGPTSVDSVFRAGPRRRGGLKRVAPGPVGMDAARVQAECSAAGAEVARRS